MTSSSIHDPVSPPGRRRKWKCHSGLLPGKQWRVRNGCK
jgi:hypothetical protein